MAKKLQFIEEFTAIHRVRGLASWPENGDRIIALATYSGTNIDSLQLVRWDGSEITEILRTKTDWAAWAADTWQESGDRMLGVGFLNPPYLAIYKWDGEEESITQIGSLDAGASVDDFNHWLVGTDRFFALAGRQTNERLQIHKWDGEASTKLAYADLNGIGTAIGAWPENGNRLVAAGYNASPYFSLFRWNGSTLSAVTTHTYSAMVLTIKSWQENGDQLIAVGVNGEPWLSLLKWNGSTLSQIASYNPGGGVATINTWTEDEKRMLAIGHGADPRFTLISWDGEAFTKEDDYTPGAAPVWAINTWDEGDDKMVGLGFDTSPYFHLIKWGIPVLTPILSAAQEGSGIKLDWEYGE